MARSAVKGAGVNWPLLQKRIGFLPALKRYLATVEIELTEIEANQFAFVAGTSRIGNYNFGKVLFVVSAFRDKPSTEVMVQSKEHPHANIYTSIVVDATRYYTVCLGAWRQEIDEIVQNGHLDRLLPTVVMATCEYNPLSQYRAISMPCEVCGRGSSHRCGNCNAVVCDNHRSSTGCAVCGWYCFAHGRWETGASTRCACGKLVCGTLTCRSCGAPVCNDCYDNGICGKCADTICKGCGKAHTDSVFANWKVRPALTVCEICGEPVCNTVWSECENCHRHVCKSHREGRLCTACSERCAICGKLVKKLYKCRDCGRGVCSDCKVKGTRKTTCLDCAALNA